MARPTWLVAFAWILMVTRLTTLPSLAADWPQFRGPDANGLADEANLPDQWDAEANVKWKAAIPGSGWSAPVVANDRIIVTTAVSEGEDNQDSVHRYEVHCFDLASGMPLWHRVASESKPRIPKHPDNTYASETPVTDGQRIVAYFGMTGVFCYDFDGNLLWQKDLGAFPMDGDWGTSSSPAMHEGLVFLQVDNEQDSFLVALEAATGDEKWRIARDEKSNWSSPVLWTNSQRTELITSGNVIRSYDPQTGALLWELTVGGGRSCSSPAPYGDVLLVGREDRSERGQGAGGLFAIRAGGAGDITPPEGATESASVIWSNRRAAPGMASPILLDGLVYILSRRGGIVGCYDADTGKEVYRKRLAGSREFWASPWSADGKLFCPGESGATHVLAAGAEYRPLHTNQLDGRFWASSALADGQVLLRSTDTLYCIAKEE
jgi:outer membrane protein assembly factor BamB